MNEQTAKTVTHSDAMCQMFFQEEMPHPSSKACPCSCHQLTEPTRIEDAKLRRLIQSACDWDGNPDGTFDEACDLIPQLITALEQQVAARQEAERIKEGSWSWALEQMKIGKRVKRMGWPPETFLGLSPYSERFISISNSCREASRLDVLRERL